MRLGAMMGLVIEEMQHREIHRQSEVLAIGHALIAQLTAKPFIAGLVHQAKNAVILDPAGFPKMIEEGMRNFIEPLMRDRCAFEPRKPAAVADIEVVERAAERAEEAAARRPKIFGGELPHRTEKTCIGPTVVPRQPSELIPQRQYVPRQF